MPSRMVAKFPNGTVVIYENQYKGTVKRAKRVKGRDFCRDFFTYDVKLTEKKVQTDDPNAATQWEAISPRYKFDISDYSLTFPE